MIDILMKFYIIVPIVLFIITIVLIAKAICTTKRYSECTGVIVRFYENDSELRVGSYETKAVSPVVSYTVNKKTYELVGKYYSTSMEVGQEMKVRYNNKDNAKAMIKTGLYFAPVITGGLTLFSILPAIIFAVLRG